MWWEVWPPIVASWGAAVVAVGFIAKKLWQFSKWGRRATAALLRLAEIGDAEAWPNGSTSLPAAMTEIYDRQSTTNNLIQENSIKLGQTAERLDAYIVAHRADHGISPDD